LFLGDSFGGARGREGRRREAAARERARDDEADDRAHTLVAAGRVGGDVPDDRVALGGRAVLCR
jgi:hypothetical protein